MTTPVLSPGSIAALEEGYVYQSRLAEANHDLAEANRKRIGELKEEIGLVAWLEKQRYWQTLPQAEELMHEWALGNVRLEHLRKIKDEVTAAQIAAIKQTGAVS